MKKAIHMNTSASTTKGAAQSDTVAASGAQMSSYALALQTFSKDFGEHQAQLTTLVVDGEPWFKGSEAAAALGYAAPAKAVRTHVDEEYRQRLDNLSGTETVPLRFSSLCLSSSSTCVRTASAGAA